MPATKALVIDDSKVAYHMLRKMLLERQIDVDWAGSGEDGLAYLQQQTPDLIFLDIMLPGMDGFAVAGAIRERATDAPPIIICSSSAAESDQPSGFDAAQAFLIKPYSDQDLDAALRRVRAAAARDSSAAPPADPNTQAQAAAGAGAKHAGAAAPAPPPVVPGVAERAALQRRRTSRRARRDAASAGPESRTAEAAVPIPATADLPERGPPTAASATQVDKRLDSISELLSAMSGQLNAVNLVLAEQRRARVAEPQRAPPAAEAGADVRQLIAVQVEQALSKRLADDQFHQLLQTLVTRAVAVQIDRVVREAADSATHQIIERLELGEHAAGDGADPIPPSTESVAAPMQSGVGALRRLWRERLQQR